MATISKRQDSPSGVFMVSVPGKRMDWMESALNFLEDDERASASSIICDLVIERARRRGWRPPAQVAVADARAAAPQSGGGGGE